MEDFGDLINGEEDLDDQFDEDLLDNDDDDDEEILGDDEQVSEDDDEVEANRDDDDENMDDDANIEVPVGMNIDNVEEEVRESPQETLFSGIDTVGMRVPLQYNQNITAVDQLLVALSQFVRHNGTYEHLMDNLKWITKQFRNINIPTTKNALWKVLGRKGDNLVYRFFCSQCKQEIGQGAIMIECACGKCGPEENESFVALFVQIRLTPQIIDLFRIPNTHEALNYKHNRVKLNENAMEDIYDGELYRSMSEGDNFFSQPYNYSFTLWTDGLKLTKSSRATTYPIVLQLNELSPHARKKHSFLTGLWIADEHPNMNTILRPTVNEFRDLYINGIPWRPDGVREVISRFIVTTFTADSLARPDVLRMKRFNGENGCQDCEAPGEIVDNRRVYRAQQYVERTDQSIRHDGLAAVAAREPVNGVKGVSALARLPRFNLKEGVAIDPAHNPFLGVAKRLMERYLTDAEEPWYIGNPDDMATIDRRLLSIKPPTRISRQPRSIQTWRTWKASEWRNWLLYYALPCLSGILDEPYFEHLSSLCTAIYILNSSSITREQLNFARDLISQFVVDYQRLYGLTNMLFNVHILNHLVQSAENLGPLWAFSALPFESLNKKITDAIKSPHARADQIITRFYIKKFITVAARQVPIADETRQEINRLLKIKDEHVEGMPEGHYFRGMNRPTIRFPHAEEIDVVQQAGFAIHPERLISIYRIATVHGVEYRIEDNIRRKFCNYVAFCKPSRRCQETRFYIIERIISYINGDQTIAGFIGRRLTSDGDAYGTPHMQHVTEVPERDFLHFQDIISPGFFIPSTEGTVVVSLCNVWETD